MVSMEVSDADYNKTEEVKKLNMNPVNVSIEYRNACQEDSSIGDMYSATTQFYVVSASWMNNFLKYASSQACRNVNSGKNKEIQMTCEDEKKSDGILKLDSEETRLKTSRPGKIFNAPLRLTNLHIQNFENNEMHPEEETNFVLRAGLAHGKDYAIIGPKAWHVLSSHFGFDFCIPRPVVSLAGQKDAVEVYPRDIQCNSVARVVVLPLGGRWNLPDDVRSTDKDSEDICFPDLYPETEDEDDAPSPLSSTFDPSSRQLAVIPSTNTKKIMTHVQQNNVNLPARKKIRKMGRCGLGNIGNTCFMNSTLQCLAHTAPLRNYFLSEEYSSDINRSNPLGTGGELATEFSKLLHQMWGCQSQSNSFCDQYYSSDSSTVVTPRNFKLTLGRHASQFVGYEQHDSHELATYLLDALHEDTNRVGKKPYVEKTEQKEDESDEVASSRSWRECLARDDSKIVHTFMGQVKSRVECPNSDCGRVSTTFDPFMYLSVPIPGSQDRTISLTFLPLDSARTSKKLKILISKSSNVGVLTEKIAERFDNLSKENIVVADIWKNEVFDKYKESTDIADLKDSDEIFAYELTTVDTIRKLEKESDEYTYKTPDVFKERPEKGIGDTFLVELLFKVDKQSSTYRHSSHHSDSSLTIPMIFRVSSRITVFGFRRLISERIKHALNGVEFVKCLKEFEAQEEKEDMEITEKENEDPCLINESEESNSSVEETVNNTNDNVDNEVVESSSNPCDMQTEFESSDDNTDKEIDDIMHLSSPMQESPELEILRRIPMTYQRKTGSYSVMDHHNRRLGKLEKGVSVNHLSISELKCASPVDDMESDLLVDYLGNRGKVNLCWPQKLLEFFEHSKLELVEQDQTGLDGENSPNKKKNITVEKCIESFCKREQLEETDKWYCNNCKTHVRAWKQFHLHRTPPILIIQLKRFQYYSSHIRNKIGDFINFPLVGLDLRNLVSSWNNDEEPIYDCYAVSNHYGGLGGGHYTAYAKNNGQWCYFDDSRVTEVVDENEVVSNAAYVLYYRRRDLHDREFDVPRTSTTSSSDISTSSSSSSLDPLVGLSRSRSNPISPSQFTADPSMELPQREMDSVVVSTDAATASCASPIDSLDGEEVGDEQGVWKNF